MVLGVAADTPCVHFLLEVPVMVLGVVGDMPCAYFLPVEYERCRFLLGRQKLERHSGHHLEEHLRQDERASH